MSGNRKKERTIKPPICVLGCGEFYLFIYLFWSGGRVSVKMEPKESLRTETANQSGKTGGVSVWECVCEKDVARCEDIPKRDWLHTQHGESDIPGERVIYQEKECNTWEAVTVKAPRNQRKRRVCVRVHVFSRWGSRTWCWQCVWALWALQAMQGHLQTPPTTHTHTQRCD